jgi:hypothetical protein
MPLNPAALQHNALRLFAAWSTPMMLPTEQQQKGRQD